MSNQNNEIPYGFKITNIGLLPEEWEVAKLEDVVRRIKGKKPDNLLDFSGTDYQPYLTAEYFRTLSPSKFVKLEPNASFITVDKNDVVFIWDGSNAGDVFTGLNGVLASTMVKILPQKSNLDNKYLFFFIKTKFDLFNSATTGSTIPHVSKQLFQNLAIPLPPLLEQKAIAGVLSTIQKAIEAQDKIIAAAREMKKSLMRHLFTYGPVPVAEAEKVPLKETEIGPVPEHWEVVRLGQLMSLRTENVLPEDVPDIRYVGLEHMDSGEVNLHRWGRTAQVRSAKSRFYPKDILYGKLRPYLDKAALAKWEGVCSTDILVFTAYNDTAFPEYLAGLLHTRACIEHAISTTSGVNHPRTSWSSIKSFAAPCPPINEQQEIAHMLSSMDNKIEVEEKRKASLQTLLKTMLHQLMTGKVRVKHLEVTAA